MALADFRYTTGISSGFKVYILEGQPSLENEQRFHRLPTHRLPAYTVRRKLSMDVKSLDASLEGLKMPKIWRAACGPSATSPEQMAPHVAEAPIAVACITTSRAEPCKDSRALHLSCPHQCPLRKPLLDPALTVSQLQQMRPSVITCAPRRSCPETPTSTSPPQIHLSKHESDGSPASPHAQSCQVWATGSAGASAQLAEEASPKEGFMGAEQDLCPSP
ncbi:uncharacterized protein LOC123023927 [Varanus komodoensis]|uniref:uncharacterized protein LOC123023927 n=1 Tax=Varanus komodoensis TaxID=61221 RepID=UPI001CF79838|nr:uncharacterized protein LOC123023927 [Varanus komodoensis]